MHGEMVIAVRNKRTGQWWSKGNRVMNFWSRAEAETQIGLLVERGASREDLEVHVERIPY